jgi:C4-dicarboxylate-binding protein DctP
MDTITVTNHADIEFIVVVNSNWWKKLTNGQRKIIADAAGVAEEHVRNYIAKIEADAYKVAKENGMKVVTPSASDIQAFKEASSSVYEQYKAKAGPLGAQLLDAASKL